jgi:hypothetical protein
MPRVLPRVSLCDMKAQLKTLGFPSSVLMDADWMKLTTRCAWPLLDYPGLQAETKYFD